MKYFEDILSKFANDENFADDKKLLLFQEVFRQVDKHKPYHVRPINVIVIDKRGTSVQNYGTTTTRLKKEN